MFRNIGLKVKVLSGIVLCLGIAASVITGMFFITKGLAAFSGGEYILTGILIAVLGSIASYISFLPLFAIGEAAENSQLILDALKKQDQQPRAITPNTIVGMGAQHIGKCELCGQQKYVRECTIEKQGEKKKVNICSDCMKV